MRTCSQVAYCLEWPPVGEDGIVADDLASSTFTIDEHATVLPHADMRVNGTANSRLRTLRSVLVSVVNDDTYAAIVCFIFQAEQNSNTGVSLLAHASGPLCIPITAAWQSDDVRTLSFDNFVLEGSATHFQMV